MMYRYALKAFRAGLLAAGLSLLVQMPGSAEAGERVPPAEVSAAYTISLNGFELGNFRYASQLTPGAYVLETDVEISALLGAFRWHGVSRATGGLAGNAPKPQRFAFNYESTTRDGSVNVGFSNAGVSTVSVAPQTARPADWVPLKDQHTKNVLDPLSAIFALTQGDVQNPCAQKVAIFDGKQRFDLELAFRRNEALGEGRGTGIVCRAKYTPIGGYRANDETRGLAESSGIEIAFRAMPKAGLAVPYRVTLPTMAGTAVIALANIDVKPQGAGQVASAD